MFRIKCSNCRHLSHIPASVIINNNFFHSYGFSVYNLLDLKQSLLFLAEGVSMAKRHHSGHFRHTSAEVWDPHPQYEFTAFGQRFRLRLAHDASFVSPDIKVRGLKRNTAKLRLHIRFRFSINNLNKSFTMTGNTHEREYNQKGTRRPSAGLFLQRVS